MLFNTSNIAVGTGDPNILCRADNNLDGTESNNDHSGAVIGNNIAIAAGGACDSAGGVGTGTFTNRVDATVEAGITARFSVTFSVVANTSLDFTSASVTITTADASSPSTGSGTSSQTLVASVSRTQTRFTTQNIQRHIDVVTGGGVAGAAPAGAPTQGGGNNVPGTGGARGETGGAGPDEDSQSNFSSLSRLSFASSEEREGDVFSTDDNRRAAAFLLPKLSFDTANGGTLASLFGTQSASLPNGDRLNQVQENVDNETIPSVQDVVRTRQRMNIWAYGSYSDIRNERNETGDDQRFTGDSLSVTMGVDHWLDDQWLAGVALSYANTELDTTFNDGTYGEDAYTVSPYVLYQPLQWLTLNASVGYTYSDIDQTQDASSNLSTSGTTADTLFGSVNAKGTYTLEDLTLAASVGYTRSHRNIESYSDSNGTFNDDTQSNSSQIKSGLEVGYAFFIDRHVIQPYATGEFLYEFQNLTNDDPSAAEMGGGIRWNNIEQALNASLESTALVGRDDYRQWNLRGILSKGFEGFGVNETVSPEASFDINGEALTFGVGSRYTAYQGALQFGVTADTTRNRNSTDGVYGLRGTAEFRF